MKPATSQLFLCCLLLLFFFPAQSQNRLLIHDKLHNSYEEYGKHDKYTIITSDSMMLTGVVTTFSNTSISLRVLDSIHVIPLNSIINLGLGAKNNKAARVTARITGYILTTVGALFTISTLEALGDSDKQAAAILGVASVTSVVTGVLMIRASYKDGNNNRDFLTRPRYRFRVVSSTF
jgi:hypothetical protein